MEILANIWEATWVSFVIFILLVVLARIIGKKLLSQLTFFDFVIGITIGTIAGAFVVSHLPNFWVLLSPIILTIYIVMIGLFTTKSLPARKILEGEPTIVIQNGKILERNLLKLRYHLDDMEMQLREKGIFNMNEVEFAILEPHGALSVLKKSQYNPITPKDLNLSTEYKGLATEIIKDGNILEQNLEQNNLDFNWLYKELRKHNINNISDVIYASLATDGSLYVDAKNDQLDYIQKVED